VLREGLELRKRGARPVAGTEDDRDDERLPCVVALERARHLLVVAVVRGDEGGADEEEHDVRLREVVVDGAGPLGARADLAIVPALDVALALQEGKVLLEPVTEGLVLVGVAVEELEGCGHGEARCGDRGWYCRCGALSRRKRDDAGGQRRREVLFLSCASAPL